MFTIPILDDTLVEGNETLTLSLSGITGSGVSLGSPASVTLTILDDDEPATIQFAAPTTNVGEGGGTATITVTRTGGTSQTASVHYATADGTAKAGQDYQATSGTLDFAASQTSQTFTIPILDDTLVEGTETLTINLSGASGAGVSLGNQSSVTLAILDDDGPTTIRLRSDHDGRRGRRHNHDHRTAHRRPRPDCDGDLRSRRWHRERRRRLSGRRRDADLHPRPDQPDVHDSDPRRQFGRAERTVLVALTNPTGGATLGNPHAATLTIVDNDSPAPVYLQWDRSSYVVDENQRSIALTITRPVP